MTGQTAEAGAAGLPAGDKAPPSLSARWLGKGFEAC
jgi:hypothetical protein